MSRSEIQRKFEQIVEFAGVEKFLDTPVKRYSSGMYIRLAFSVAAHLEPEILIVDEVLAVGDTEFQKKCLGKLQDVAGHGRTVLFVSHNLAAVKSLCTKGIVLERGKAQQFSTIEGALSHFVEPMKALHTDLSKSGNRKGTGIARFVRVSVKGPFGDIVIPSGSDVIFEFDIEAFDDILESVNVAFSIRTIDGTPLSFCSSEQFGESFRLGRGLNKAFCKVRSVNFVQGDYLVSISCSVNDVFLDWVQDATILHIGSPAASDWQVFPPREKSIVLLEQEWNCK
jgi:lipopolysaccharide transport system ATP-binding protein